MAQQQPPFDAAIRTEAAIGQIQPGADALVQSVVVDVVRGGLPSGTGTGKRPGRFRASEDPCPSDGKAMQGHGKPDGFRSGKETLPPSGPRAFQTVAFGWQPLPRMPPPPIPTGDQQGLPRRYIQSPKLFLHLFQTSFLGLHSDHHHYSSVKIPSDQQLCQKMRVRVIHLGGRNEMRKLDYDVYVNPIRHSL